MKKRLTGKPACIAILAVLFILSIVDVILRAFVLSDIASTAANYGEVLITAAFALMLIIVALKGKDRLFYILCGAYLGYFVINQLFSIPLLVNDLVFSLQIGSGKYFIAVAYVFHLLSVIGIVAIGGLIVEYMNSGTIYNKAFNTLCIITVLLLTSGAATSIFGLIAKQMTFNVLAVIYNISRLTTIFLFVTFAYDSAKQQLAKTKL